MNALRNAAKQESLDTKKIKETHIFEKKKVKQIIKPEKQSLVKFFQL